MSAERSTVTEGAGFACEECGRTFETAIGAGVHRVRAHRGGPEHGTLAGYRDGCRCEACRTANRDRKRKDRRWRDHLRAIDGNPQTLSACLAAFGVPEEKLAGALEDRSVEELHWGLFLSPSGGSFRTFCRCEMPDYVVSHLEAS